MRSTSAIFSPSPSEQASVATGFNELTKAVCSRSAHPGSPVHSVWPQSSKAAAASSAGLPDPPGAANPAGASACSQCAA